MAGNNLFSELSRPLRSRKFITEFFVVFSRFEYALKRAGYVEKVGNNKKDGKVKDQDDAKVDWDKFAQTLKDEFETAQKTNPKLTHAVKYLLEDSPPKKLVRLKDDIDGKPQLCWYEDKSGDKSLARLLILVRRVRNNLFHGEKTNLVSGGIPEAEEFERGRNLIEFSLIVMNTCLDLSPEVKEIFYNNAQSRLQTCSDISPSLSKPLS